MDAFESLIATLLRRDGWWVETSVKVTLTKEEKRAVGRSSSPRWELDVVAYKAGSNEVLVIECKSFIDSRGVVYNNGRFWSPGKKSAYKLFDEAVLRMVVLDGLRRQLVERRSCSENVRIRLGLATGRVARGTDRAALKQWFDKEGWLLMDDLEIRRRLTECVSCSYENDPVLVAAKVLLRES
jgi:hypothetical protein